MRRRIEIQIERRELSVFISPASNTGADGTGGTTENGELATSSLSQNRPERCPTCGSTEMLLLADAIAHATCGQINPGSRVELPDCHLHCSSSKEWWVCKPSLHLIKASLRFDAENL